MRNPIQLLCYSLLLFSLIACKKEVGQIEVVESGYVQYGTPFQGVPETQDIVLYEVNLRAFSASGDIQGVINKLDHIEALGINVIWLMPIHPIGQIKSVNSPYSVRDYKAVAEEYGSLEDLRKLTTLAHERGIAVMMDWVANHTSWDNEWINNTQWYTQDSEGNIIHPPGTNWQDVADLNYDNEAMREAMIDAMTYWAYEANIDGFRCDYADGVPFDFWKQAIETISAIPDREFIFFAEGTRSNHFTAGFDLNFSWSFYGAIKNAFNGQSAQQVFEAHQAEYANMAADKHWVRFTTNHDESAWDATPISLFNGLEGALAASVATIYMGGIPLIYGSQEVGTANTIPFFSNSSINWNENPALLSAYQKILQYYAGSAVAKAVENTVYPHDAVITFKKTLNNEEFLVLVNTRNTAIDYNLPEELNNTSWTDVMNQNAVNLDGQLTLNPYQFYIIER